MDFKELQCFLIVAEELHFAKAAERLGTTQSAISRQLATLERHLGGKLFNRAKRSQVGLTSTGALLLPEAQAVMRQMHRAETLGRRAARGEAGRLEIGFVASSAWDGTVVDLVRRYRKFAPDVEIHLRELETPRQLEEIVAGRLDLGVLRIRTDYPVEIKAKSLKHDNLRVALPNDDPLAHLSKLSPKMLSNRAFILPHFGEEAGFMSRLQAVGRAGGFDPHILPPVRDFLTVLTAVAAGLGLGLVPEQAATLGLSGVTLRPIEGLELGSELMLASRRTEHSPAVRQFLSTVI